MTNPLKNRKGMTLLEIIVVVTLLSVVLVGTVSIQMGMMNVWQHGASGTNSSTYASIAVRKLVLEMEEGRSATAAVDGSTVTVSFPFLDTSTGDYIRTQPGVTATFYLSGENGTEETGECLWKSVAGTNTLLARHVSSVVFRCDNGKLVKIQIEGTDQEGGAIEPRTVYTSVKLRNS